jgi:predicted  nucleic acid-binding Zn-ribbon protein
VFAGRRWETNDRSVTGQPAADGTISSRRPTHHEGELTMAAPAPAPLGKPDRDFVEDLFEHKEFQKRLDAAVRPFRTLSTVLGVFGIGAVAIFSYAGKYLSDRVQELNARTTSVNADVTKLLADAQKRFDEAQAKINGVENSAAAVLRQAEQVSRDAQSQASLLMAQSQNLTSSTALASQALGQMKSSLDENVKGLSQAMADLRKGADEFKQIQKQQTDDQKTIRDTQKSIGELQSSLSPSIKTTLASMETLRQRAGEIAKYKTMEFVSLRAGSNAQVKFHHIQENASKELETAPYDLLFSTGKLKPLAITLTVNKGPALTYSGVETDKKNPDRKSYCICGTPFMFRVENYVQEMLIHDFVTLKVLDRTPSCALPQQTTEASCR